MYIFQTFSLLGRHTKVGRSRDSPACNPGGGQSRPNALGKKLRVETYAWPTPSVPSLFRRLLRCTDARGTGHRRQRGRVQAAEVGDSSALFFLTHRRCLYVAHAHHHIRVQSYGRLHSRNAWYLDFSVAQTDFACHRKASSHPFPFPSSRGSLILFSPFQRYTAKVVPFLQWAAGKSRRMSCCCWAGGRDNRLKELHGSCPPSLCSPSHPTAPVVLLVFRLVLTIGRVRAPICLLSARALFGTTAEC